VPVVRRLAILGSTGSIGRSALSVVQSHRDRLEVVAMAAGGNVALFAEQVETFRPRAVAMASGAAVDRLRRHGIGDAAEVVGHGSDGLVALATHPDVDMVLCASSGTAALEAVLAAIEAGKTIALANKEVLVMAGALVTEAARRRGVAILPVDSEHSAIFQCLEGSRYCEHEGAHSRHRGGEHDCQCRQAARHPDHRQAEFRNGCGAPC
jgi:1-deoxy-D-xylulose-5-phosphate reductoisomerase